jgi:ADP-ribose pyrophosphatase
MANAPKIEIISRKLEFEGWHRFETIILRHVSLAHGGMLAPIQREMLYCGTCVVGLLYIPETDELLLNEQFRIGPHIAGDPNPWLLECCAGMVDKGEKPEEALKREAIEETGCEVLDYEFIGKAYPSPGGTDETYMLYCARISPAATGHFGLADEGEEIKTHILPVAEAIRLLDTGKITNGGTVMCLNWFARHHSRLREKWSGK